MVVIQQLAPGGTDPGDVGGLMHVIVELAQPAVLEVLQHGGKAAFRLAEKHRVSMAGHLRGVQHDRDAAENRGNALLAVTGGDLEGARQLTGQ